MTKESLEKLRTRIREAGISEEDLKTVLERRDKENDEFDIEIQCYSAL